MRWVAVLLILAALAAPASAGGEQDVPRRVEVRVTAFAAGVAQVDRGLDARIEPGDRAVLYPFGGSRLEGRVVSVDDRAARVQLGDASAVVEPGTPGEVYVPEERFKAAPVRPGQEAPEHPPWKAEEEGFTTDMPLLAEVQGTRPAERPTDWRGRWYAFVDHTMDDEGGESEYTYFGTGLDLSVENPFGRGGTLRFDGELSQRTEDVEDRGSEDETFARLERLSYAWGGTREAPRRLEFGRFLQREFPELGVLDGVEVIQRLPGGDRVGGSVGFMPEPNADFETGDDMQTAIFYRHVAGEREEFSVGGAFQKTWHEGDADRDLFVGNLRWFPREGWNANATAWVDLYGSEDEAKSSGAELTQLNARAGYRWGAAGGASLTYTELRYPELLRWEFPPVSAEELADDHQQRIGLSGWKRVSPHLRLSGRVDTWEDEDDTGNGGELRADLSDLLGERSRFTAAVFTNEGKFSDVLGLRLSYGRATSWGLWDVMWEVAELEQHDFSGDQGDLLQHRLRGTWDVAAGADWSLSLYAEERFGDEQDSTTLGLYLQRSF